jgi:hypothetical protein
LGTLGFHLDVPLLCGPELIREKLLGLIAFVDHLPKLLLGKVVGTTDAVHLHP